MHRSYIIYLLILITMILVGCSSASTPELIASYPSGEDREMYIPQDPSMEHSLYVYDAFLELESASVKESAKKAEQVAIDNGGYLVSRESWIVDGRTRSLLVLAVPAVRFEATHASLKRLGRVLNEQVSGEWQSIGYGDTEWTLYSQITLRLQPRASVWPDIRLPSISIGWHPGRTLQHALSVFLTIFGFLADILIWTSVVMGPFVLLFIGGRALVRRLRRGS
jgi:hypothetical protein